MTDSKEEKLFFCIFCEKDRTAIAVSPFRCACGERLLCLDKNKEDEKETSEIITRLKVIYDSSGIDSLLGYCLDPNGNYFDVEKPTQTRSQRHEENSIRREKSGVGMIILMFSALITISLLFYAITYKPATCESEEVHAIIRDDLKDDLLEALKALDKYNLRFFIGIDANSVFSGVRKGRAIEGLVTATDVKFGSSVIEDGICSTTASSIWALSDKKEEIWELIKGLLPLGTRTAGKYVFFEALEQLGGTFEVPQEVRYRVVDGPFTSLRVEILQKKSMKADLANGSSTSSSQHSVGNNSSTVKYSIRNRGGDDVTNSVGTPESALADFKKSAFASRQYFHPDDPVCALGSKNAPDGFVLGEILESISGDFNGDHKQDMWVRLEGSLCGGGNAVSSLEFFVVSVGNRFDVLDVVHADQRLSSVTFTSTRVLADGKTVLVGNLIEYAPDDPRCCPSIAKRIAYHYPTKTLLAN